MVEQCRSHNTSELGQGVNTITMTAAEKKAMRDEIERKKRAAKKKKAEAERMRKLAEEAEMEKGRGTSHNMHQMFAIINYVWGLYVHIKIIIVTDAKKHNMKRGIEFEISVQH